MDKKFDLDDIVLIPAEESNITSRKQCTIESDFNERSFLPIMASPMDTVVSPENYQLYVKNGIIPCMPRGQYVADFSCYKDNCFQSFGLSEIEEQLKMLSWELFDNSENTFHFKFEKDYWLTHNHGADALIETLEKPKGPYPFYYYEHVLIDIANGHMSKLLKIVEEIKTKCPNIKLMVGNVANPETFVNLANAGADYVRISIGTGAGCTTAANVAVNYPMGSLISECRAYKLAHGCTNTKIVADGGMKNYADIIKALALGADYVMMGSTFNKSIESAGFNYLWKIKINNKIAETLWTWGFPIKKKYRGMSTKAVQRSWGKTNLVTAEGITKYQRVEYTLEQWTENFKDYLKSAMSYCNANNLDNFIGKAQYVFISDASRRRFEK